VPNVTGCETGEKMEQHPLICANASRLDVNYQLLRQTSSSQIHCSHVYFSNNYNSQYLLKQGDSSSSSSNSGSIGSSGRIDISGRSGSSGRSGVSSRSGRSCGSGSSGGSGSNGRSGSSGNSDSSRRAVAVEGAV
jgi:hypothetical protein